ncbi:MAG: FitA-like ribbon-helix-helix domain-containing protein [Egibacteraceae bacterium]
MGKPLQIRDVPDETLDVLRERAKREGLSLSAYALRLLRHEAERPTMQEVLDRAASRGSGLRLTPQQYVDIINEGREERG